MSSVPRVVNQQFQELLAADLDGDGCNELVAWMPGRCRVYKMRNDRMEEVEGYDTDALPVIGDFDGDGLSEIAVVRIDPNGTPLIEVFAPARKDKALWRTQLSPPGHLTLAWSSRPAYLRTGRFTGRQGMDLFAGVPVVRSLVLDGGTGRLVWEKSEMPDFHRYWGPTMNLAAACDTIAMAKTNSYSPTRTITALQTVPSVTSSWGLFFHLPSSTNRAWGYIPCPSYSARMAANAGYAW